MTVLCVVSVVAVYCALALDHPISALVVTTVHCVPSTTPHLLHSRLLLSYLTIVTGHRTPLTSPVYVCDVGQSVRISAVRDKGVSML